MPSEKSERIKLFERYNTYLRLSSGESRVRSSGGSVLPKARGVNSPNSTIRFAGSDKYSVLDYLTGLYRLTKSDISEGAVIHSSDTNHPDQPPKLNNSTPRPAIQPNEKTGVRVSADDCEALVDELMAIVDFGQAIDEPYLEIAGERCLRIIQTCGGEK